VLALVGTPGKPPTTLGKYYNKSVPYNSKIQSSWDPGLIDRFIRAMYHPPYRPAIFEHNGTTYYINNFEEFVAQNV
jgi:UDP-4-amino-4-deoxy-L-arabinose formyltransferase/UDP-glucuronic acid dehydrogenase (UDP-4-keto-hexauronic acid decarboxylating)